jgi:hypothetical protein
MVQNTAFKKGWHVAEEICWSPGWQYRVSKQANYYRGVSILNYPYHRSHIVSLNSQGQIYKNQNGTIIKQQVKIDTSQIEAIEAC